MKMVFLFVRMYETEFQKLWRLMFLIGVKFHLKSSHSIHLFYFLKVCGSVRITPFFLRLTQHSILL